VPEALGCAVVGAAAAGAGVETAAGALSAAPGCGALSREQAAQSADASARMKIDLIMFNLTFSTRSVARAGPLHARCDHR
jgi:hypothetical protein